jgi:hypothetical protein
MPDMLAHYLVAEEAARRLDGEAATRFVTAAPDAFTVGAQGPDVFFYSHLLSRRGRPNLAHLTHQYKMSAAFRSMLAYSVALPPDERDVALAFIAGYAAHLCLDAGAHPWVLYWTGDITDGASPEVRTLAYRRHGILEASIDVILRREHGGGTDWLRKQRILHLPARQRKVIVALLSAMLGDVYDLDFSPEEGDSAFRTMEKVYGTMSDPRSLVSRLLLAAAPLIDRSGMVRTQVYPEEPAQVAEQLFCARRPWYYPSIPSEPRTWTFAEICERATAETVSCLCAIAAAASGDLAIEEAVETIGDRSMLSGVACDDPRPRVAFAPDRGLMWGDEKPV